MKATRATSSTRCREASLGRVFILFPDPWPKTRHHKRRFIQTEMLDALARVMKPAPNCVLPATMPAMPTGRWSG